MPVRQNKQLQVTLCSGRKLKAILTTFWDFTLGWIDWKIVRFINNEKQPLVGALVLIVNTIQYSKWKKKSLFYLPGVIKVEKLTAVLIMTV